jgi:hypothetical protein
MPRIIDYTIFKKEYWAHFPPQKTRNISVDLAFLEIMGVIKGSMSQTSGLKPLLREEYLERRWRRAPNFATEGERDRVYSIYEYYEKVKRRRGGEIDGVDRVTDVLKALIEKPGLKERLENVLDEVYVDGQYSRSLIEWENHSHGLTLGGVVRGPRSATAGD